MCIALPKFINFMSNYNTQNIFYFVKIYLMRLIKNIKLMLIEYYNLLFIIL